MEGEGCVSGEHLETWLFEAGFRYSSSRGLITVSCGWRPETKNLDLLIEISTVALNLILPKDKS